MSTEADVIAEMQAAEAARNGQVEQPEVVTPEVEPETPVVTGGNAAVEGQDFPEPVGADIPAEVNPTPGE